MQTSESRQLWLLVLLLAVAVILPTVCLLWFVSVAVKNERLAVRQRLVNFYTERAEKSFIEYPNSYWQEDKEKLSGSAQIPAKNFFRLFAIGEDSNYQGMVIYDVNGAIVYPVVETEQYFTDSDSVLEKIWETEYIEKDYVKAANAYGKLADGNDADLRAAALVGEARCLKKAGRLSEAAKACERLGWGENINKGDERLIADARLMQIQLYQATADPRFFESVEKIFENRFSDLSIRTAKKLFLLTESIEVAKNAGIAGRLTDLIRETENEISAEKISLDVAEILSNTYSAEQWSFERFRRLGSSQPVYIIGYNLGNRKVIGIVNQEKLSAFWKEAVEQIEDEMVFCRALDETDEIIAGTPEMWAGTRITLGRRFLNLDLGKFFPAWRVDLYFRGGVFTATAKRQQLIYFWTLALVIGSMVVVSSLVTRSIWQQIRLNKLKNDFIATVTHELKTPLSSMRVLVDTLLEGRYEGQQQVTEYLQLVSKENKRLSHLIDNFLTFSRMERNKQAFEFAEVRADKIAKAAAEAVSTKFNKENCKFTVTIDNNLPFIYADRDAMVTVLVNLLDNAYKYSQVNKQIELKVFAENSRVCFSVKDNGIGIGRRTLKKIFSKFYQADSSLARRAEGTGLGLSIVKFIVDAHKGTIEVESKPGQGSNFIVKIPIEK